MDLIDALRAPSLIDPAALSHVFLLDGEESQESLTRGALDARARKVAADLIGLVPPGGRALLVYPQGLDFLAAFLGCLYAGVTAVPAYPPDVKRIARTLPRLQAIAHDCGPSAVLGPRSLRDALLLSPEAGGLASLPWIAPDPTAPLSESSFEPRALQGSTLAYLQYTSGSTAAPKGVMISHANLLANLEYGARAVRQGTGSVKVSWVPQFHDLGLVMDQLGAVYGGFPCVFMSPEAFVQRPVRWLRAISRFRGTHASAPNFGYDLVARRLTDADAEGLDLSCWEHALNGAEPVRPATLARFAAAVAPYGFRAAAQKAAFGLAEATAVVTCTPSNLATTVFEADADALADNRVESKASGGSTRSLAASGRAFEGVTVLVVDPDTCAETRADQVGEIWVAGDSIGQGYWNRPQETIDTFRGYTNDGRGPFLRTGDLGFVRDGDLYVTGRIKDLVILGGRNLYPQDVEQAAEGSHPLVRAGCTAAFAIEDDQAERLAVVAEMRSVTPLPVDEIVAAIRRDVAAQLNVTPHTVALVAERSIPKTSSGKIQRRATRAAFAAGQLALLGQWTAPEEGFVAAVTESPRSAADIEAWIMEYLVGLGTPVRLDPREPFKEWGLGSIESVELAGGLAKWLSRNLPETLAWQHPTPRELARHLAGDPPPVTSVSPTFRSEPRTRGDAIAIVGTSCRLPGGIDDLESLWRFLEKGGDAVTEVPANRWSLDAHWSKDPRAPGRSVSRHGAFLSDVAGFDAAFFNISPREAAAMDPQQRLLLELAHEAFEDAGIPREELAGSRTGVFVGATHSEYAWLSAMQPEQVDAHTATGSFPAVIANRVSYEFDLRGPSYVVDSVCSASLVALHVALQSLRSGECDTALVGATMLLLRPDMHLWFSKLGVMSPGGRCRAFDAAGDGIVLGEGAAALVLKPLEAAERCGDRVLAVIRGSAVTQDGRSNGLAAPRRETQEHLLSAAWADAGLSPLKADYVEAHGTGTVLGDPVEALALGTVMGAGRTTPLLIGSIKSNLGHLSIVGGMAGLLKIVAAFRARMLPRTLHVTRPNPQVPWSELQLALTTELQTWPETGEPFRAGVTSLSFGGTNAHIVLESAPPPTEIAPPEDTPNLLVLSARTPAALQALGQRWEQQKPTGRSSDACFTAAMRRTHFEERLTIAFRTPDELLQRLQLSATGQPAPFTARGRVEGGKTRRLVFVFSGQGGQWAGMGRGLSADPVAAAALTDATRAVSAQGGPDVASILVSGKALDRIDRIQPALFALQVALGAMLRSRGIRPDAVIGHSVGEVAAAHVAGALTLNEAARVVVARSRLLQEIAGAGAMALFDMTADEAMKLAAGRATVAARNAGRTTVLAGTPADIESVLAAAAARGIFARRVDADVAAHSPQVDPLLDRLRTQLEGLSPQAGTAAFVSTVSGEEESGQSLDASYWVRNLRAPVAFADAVTAVSAGGPCTFVEIGPHPLLIPSIEETTRGKHAVTISLARRDEDEALAMTAACGALFVHGHSVDLARVVAPGRVVALPAYPFEREALWIAGRSPGRADEMGARPGGAGFRLSEPLEVSSHPGTTVRTTRLSVNHLDGLAVHRAAGAPLFPAAAIAELMLHGSTGHELADLDLHTALYLPEGEERDVQIVIDGTGVTLNSRGEGGWVRHATARLVGRCGGAVPEAPATDESVEAAVIQTRLHALGIVGASGIRDARRGPAGGTARLFPASGAAPSQVALLDAALQAAFPLLTPFAEAGVAMVTHMDRLAWLADPDGDLSGSSVEVHDRGGRTFDLTVRGVDGRALAVVSGVRVHVFDQALPAEAFVLRWETEAPPAGAPNRSVCLVGGASDDVAALSAALGARGVRVTNELAEADAVVDLRATLAPPFADAQTSAAFARDLLDLAGTLSQRAEHGSAPRLWVVTRFAQRTGEEPAEAMAPSTATLWGLARVLAEEHPEIWAGVCDVDVVGASLAAEVSLRAEGPREVALRGPERLVPRLRATVLPESQLSLRSDATYLVTGGRGDIGLMMAEWLAQSGAKRVALLGRSAEDAGALASISRLRAGGVEVISLRGDVNEPAQVKAALEALGSPPVRGLIHAAAVVEDRLVTNLDRPTLEAVLAPKMALRALEEALGPLDFVLSLSSIGGSIGLPGQGAYAAANAWLDAHASERQKAGACVVALALGPVAGSRRAENPAAGQARRAMAARGIMPVDPAGAWNPAGRALSSNRPGNIAALALDLARLHGRVPPALQGLAGGRSTPRQQPDAPLTLDQIESRVQRELSAVLRLPVERIDPRRPFGAYGLDSLLALELRNRLETNLGLSLPATLAWNYPSVAELARHLAERLHPEPSASEVEAPAAAHAIVIEELSDEDALRRLAHS